MATAWTMTREALADRALAKCGVLGAEQTPSSADRQLALDALDGIIKQLPLYGLAWPKVKQNSATLIVTALATGIAMPTDYFGGPVLVNRIDPVTGDETPLTVSDLTFYNEIADKDRQAAVFDTVFLDPSKFLRVYPLATQTLTIKVWYQAVLDDTVAATVPGSFGPEWMLGLVYGIAAEIGDEFGVAADKLNRFELKWREIRARAMMAQSSSEPVILTVAEA